MDDSVLKNISHQQEAANFGLDDIHENTKC